VAIIAVMLATGLREGEIVKLVVDDLYQTYGNVPALRVKSGKGAKAPMSRQRRTTAMCWTARPVRR